jgi:hypothetical protein
VDLRGRNLIGISRPNRRNILHFSETIGINNVQKERTSTNLDSLTSICRTDSLLAECAKIPRLTITPAAEERLKVPQRDRSDAVYRKPKGHLC